MRSRADLAGAKRVVVKVGSALLAEDKSTFERLGKEIAGLRRAGHEVVLVSSGAIALGWPLLGFNERPPDLAGLQAAAAAGQGQLLQRWGRAFEAEGIEVAQILLTHSDLEHRRRYLNARRALCRLLECGALPVVNENDTVSVDEIKLGDNDLLAASVSGLVDAQLVILLTGADGLFTAAPERDPAARRIPIVDSIDDAIRGAAGPAATFGTGGMVTKLRAAEHAGRHGAATVIAPGRRPGVLAEVLRGDDIGTLFTTPDEPPERARKRWIQTVLRPRGTLFVDAGARGALAAGASLLPAGLRRVEGTFGVGDCVEVAVEGESPFARGLVAFPHGEAAAIAGLQTDEVKAKLGAASPDELIHRDDLVLDG